VRRFKAVCATAALAMGIWLGASGLASASEPSITVLTGADRYETAIKVSQEGFPAGAPAVVIAKGDNFPDALCAAPLAHAYGGPLLLTPSSGLIQSVLDEIERLGASSVFVVGLGRGSTAMMTALEAVAGKSSVTVLQGVDRYETAVLVARQLKAKIGTTKQAVIAPGDTYPDALSAAPLAAAEGLPILLTPQWGSLPKVTVDAIAELGITSAIEVGTRAPVGLSDVTRLVGRDRYETCALIADYALDRGLEMTHTAFATGNNFPDGLASAPYLALDAGTLLLTNGQQLTAPVEQLLSTNGTAVRSIDAIGINRVTGSGWLDWWNWWRSRNSTTTTTKAPMTTTTARPTTTTAAQPIPTTSTTVRPTTTTLPPTTTTARPTTTTVHTTPTTVQPPASTTTTRPPTTPTAPTTQPSTTPTTSGNMTVRTSGVGLASGATIQNTIFRSTSWRDNVTDISGHGINGATLRNLRFENAMCGMKIGTGNQSYNLNADGITAVGNFGAMFLANVSNSTFKNMNLDCYYAPNAPSGQKNHVIYLERGNHNLTFLNVKSVGGSNWPIHLYNYESQSQPSDNILFDGLDVDCQVGAIIISEGWSKVTMRNVKARAGNGWPVFRAYGAARDVVIENFEAWGPGPLVDKASGLANPVNWIFRNGVYHGPSLGSVPGVTFENVRLEP